MSLPRRVARVIRTGRAKRREPLMPFTVIAMSRLGRSRPAGPRKWDAPLALMRRRQKK